MSSGKKTPKPDEKKNIAAIDAVKEASPLQKMMDARATKYFDWENSTGAYAGRPKDVTEAPGADANLDIYGTAERLASEKRFSNPGLAFSTPSNNGYSDQLAAQGQMQRYDTRAAGLAEGLNNTRAQSYGIADTSIGNEMNRKQSYAQLLGANSRDFYNRPQKPALWSQIAGLAIGGAGAAAGLGLKF